MKTVAGRETLPGRRVAGRQSREPNMPYRFVNVSAGERIATVTLNNPPSNLLTTSVLTELDQIFGELEASDDIRVVVLTATGRFFCPGADMKELTLLATAYQGSELSGRGQALLNRIERSDKPVIAAINGTCLGGGLNWQWPATCGWRPRGLLSACRRSNWASSRVSAGPNGSNESSVRHRLPS